MFILREYVPANEIWPEAKVYIDHGYRSGLQRGYNIEVALRDGSTSWLSCEWTSHSNPDEFFNDEFHTWSYKEHGWKPTGRICFRGYGEERYDPQEHEWYIYRLEELGILGVAVDEIKLMEELVGPDRYSDDVYKGFQSEVCYYCMNQSCCNGSKDAMFNCPKFKNYYLI